MNYGNHSLFYLWGALALSTLPYLGLSAQYPEESWRPAGAISVGGGASAATFTFYYTVSGPNNDLNIFYYYLMPNGWIAGATNDGAPDVWINAEKVFHTRYTITQTGPSAVPWSQWRHLLVEGGGADLEVPISVGMRYVLSGNQYWGFIFPLQIAPLVAHRLSPPVIRNNSEGTREYVVTVTNGEQSATWDFSLSPGEYLDVEPWYSASQISMTIWLKDGDGLYQMYSGSSVEGPAPEGWTPPGPAVPGWSIEQGQVVHPVPDEPREPIPEQTDPEDPETAPAPEEIAQVQESNIEARHTEVKNLWERQAQQQAQLIDETSLFRRANHAQMETANEHLGTLVTQGGAAADRLESIDGHLEALADAQAQRDADRDEAAGTDWAAAGQALRTQAEQMAGGAVPSYSAGGGVLGGSPDTSPWEVHIPQYGTINMNPFSSPPAWMMMAAAWVRELILWALVFWMTRDLFIYITENTGLTFMIKATQAAVGPESLIPGVSQVKVITMQTIIIGVIVGAIAAAILITESALGALAFPGFSSIASVVSGTLQTSAAGTFVSTAWGIMEIVLPLGAIVKVALAEFVCRATIFAAYVVVSAIIRMIGI